MKRYSLLQEYEVTGEDLAPIKDVSVHLVVTAKDITEDRVTCWINQIANGFSELILDESSEIEKGFAALNEKLMSKSEGTGKRWFN